MEYSEFELEQLNFFPQYKELCDKLLGLAKNDEEKEVLESILYNGGYKNYKPCGNIGRDNPEIDIQRRAGLAYLFLRNRETFDQIINNDIIYFHGTNANALPGIIKYGINSFDISKENEIDVTTGESWSRFNGKRDFISFTDVLDIAEGYSGIKPKKETELSFPIIFGTTKKNLLQTKVIRIHSDIQEVGVKDHFPKELISCVLVPSSKIDIVKKIVDSNISVLPADDINDRFYSIENFGFFDISFSEEEYQEMKKGIFENKDKVLSGIEKAIFSRTLDKMNHLMEFFGGKLNGRNNIR